MSDQVLYRKYRPQSFGDVLGQEHITNALSGAIGQGTFSHAYLFAGSRGTGKTSVARIFAKEIGASDNDVHEIDAASYTGVENIRELRDAANIQPLESQYKVYIIDEVHMLSRSAFNALLKTLEEPPAHVVFILATTEREKLPETIISRCQTFSFKQPAQSVLKDMITRIAEQEGYALEPAAAELIALLAEGSFRDAQSILQMLFASAEGTQIDRATAEAATGAPKAALVNEYVAAVDTGEIAQGLQAVQTAGEQQIDMKLFLKLVLHKLRAVLLLKYAPDMNTQISEQFTKEDLSYLKELSEKQHTGVNSRALDTVLAAAQQLPAAAVPQLPLELALIKLSETE